MANFTFTVPDSLVPHLRDIMQAETETMLTGKALFLAWFKQVMKPKLEAKYRRERVQTAIDAEVTARLEAEAALDTEAAARKTAEATEATNAATDIGSVT